MIRKPKIHLPSEKDPWMVNLKGKKVRVPLHLVKDLLKKGFKMASEQWDEETESPETITDGGKNVLSPEEI